MCFSSLLKNSEWGDLEQQSNQRRRRLEPIELHTRLTPMQMAIEIDYAGLCAGAAEQQDGLDGPAEAS